jgi:uncharacterized protein YdeI (YjbR/CyaY-like superfamily)
MPNVADLPAPPPPTGAEVFIPPSSEDWRAWLAEHPDRDEGVWLVYRKAKSELEGPRQPELLDEALCFGWIDSKVVPVDDDRTMQWFSPRRAGGIWSGRNRARITELELEGRIADPGRAAIEQAKRDGSWEQSDSVDALEVPEDLTEALASHPEASAAFDSLSASRKKQYLWWIHSAKRAETRTRRVAETIQRLAEET